jgi:hypothetical protein
MQTDPRSLQQQHHQQFNTVSSAMLHTDMRIRPVSPVLLGLLQACARTTGLHTPQQHASHHAPAELLLLLLLTLMLMLPEEDRMLALSLLSS